MTEPEHSSSRNRTGATVAGFLLAPLVPACTFAATSPGLTDNSWKVAVALIPVFYLFALFATGFFALPLYLLLERTNRLTIWSTLVSGLAIGAAVLGVMGETAEAALFGAGVGAGAALVFWLTRYTFRRSMQDA